MSDVDYYLKKVLSNLKYHAIWVPNTKITLGNYGYFEKGDHFKVLGNLETHGIKFNPLPPAPNINMEYQSTKGMNVSFDAEKLNVKISFGKDTSMITKFVDIKCHRIENQPELRDKLIELLKSGVWEKDFWLITEILAVQRIAVIIGKGSNNYLKLKASIPIEHFDPIEIGFGLEIQYKTGQVLCFTNADIDEKEITPLFRVSHLTEEGTWKGPTDVVFNEDDLILQEFPYI